MSVKFNSSFKEQAIEKALNRSDGTSIEKVAEGLGVGYSTLQKWIRQSHNQTVKPNTESVGNLDQMSKEKRPQDWSAEDKLTMVIACSSLDEPGISALCRERGLYPHHVDQWKKELILGLAPIDKARHVAENKQLKAELKNVKKELQRKEKALAETAALLVLQKKVNAIWGNDEDNSQ